MIEHKIDALCFDDILLVPQKSSISINGSLSQLNSALLEAAKYVYKISDPFILAAYQYQANRDNLEETCLKTIRSIINNNEDDVHWAYNLWGIILAEQRKFDLAIEKFDNAIKEAAKAGEDYPQAYLNWGNALQEMGKYDEAFDMYKKSIQIDDNLVYGYFSLGFVRHNQKSYLEAIEWYDQAIKVNKYYAPAYTNSGFAFTEIKKYDEAIKKFERAIDIDPNDCRIYIGYGNLFYNQKKFLKAIEFYDKGIEKDSKNALAFELRGAAYSKITQYERAISDFNKSLEINPKQANAYNHISWILATCPNAIYRDGAKAVEIAEKGLELGKDPSILDTLAAAYAEAGKFEDAIKIEEEVILMLKKEENASFQINECTEHLNYYKSHKPWREK